MNLLIQPKRTIALFPAAFVFACFTLSPRVQGVVPPPDGGYANRNTAEGTNALFNLTSGSFNTAIGFQALFSGTSGGDNTATGFQALFGNTTGEANTATGIQALFNNTTGSDNTANGVSALAFNTTGVDNTANGYQALFSNTTGFNNTATGILALFSNTTGGGNTANSASALFSNTTGSNNTANGQGALFSNTTGSDNTAHGVDALFGNTTGFNNTATGILALFSNTTGNNNIALGIAAGFALTTGSNNIDIGNNGGSGDDSTIRIGDPAVQTGNTYIAGIFGVPIANSAAVVVDASGHLGTMVSATSSVRFKDEIKPMDKASEAILALKPVTFRYKKELDPKGIPQFGLVAEDVEKVNPALVARDVQGKPYTVRYDAVNAMLLNEFLKAHRQIEEQQKEIEALRTLIQKVRDKVELKTATQQTIANNQ